MVSTVNKYLIQNNYKCIATLPYSGPPYSKKMLYGVMSVVENILEANIIDYDICDITFTKSIS